MKQRPTRDRLFELLDFDHGDGMFRWKKTLGSRAKEGSIAGSVTSQGYVVIRLDGELWRAHHLAWLAHHGCWPDGLVIHRNRQLSDNRIENLAMATKQEAHAHTKAEAVNPHNVHLIFRYDDGVLRWRQSLSGKSRIANAVAGHVNDDGYVVVETGGKAIGAHRIIWLMHYGEWPAGEIDHLNGIRSDNRIENIRDVVRVTNTENRRSAPRHSRSGMLGVEKLSSDRFRARIRSKGKLHELGVFGSAEAAHKAYVEAKRTLHAGNTL